MQVLVNLLHNAAKFTPSGDITLAYNIMKEGQRICFTITDTGPGIPLEKQEAVFSRLPNLTVIRRVPDWDSRSVGELQISWEGV